MEKLKENKSESFISLFKQIISRFPNHRRMQFWILFFAMVFVALLETIATIGIAFFASTVSSPDYVLQSDHIITARKIIGSDFVTTVGAVTTAGASHAASHCVCVCVPSLGDRLHL